MSLGIEALEIVTVSAGFVIILVCCKFGAPERMFLRRPKINKNEVV